MFLLQQPSLSPSHNLKLSHKGNPLLFTRPPIAISLKPSFKPLSCAKESPSSPTLPQTIQSLKPYILAEHGKILRGWICSLVSVYSLSKIVPRVGKFSSNLSDINGLKKVLRDQGLVFGALVVARLVASYWQQAFLWDAALHSVYNIRVFVYEKVLERDLGFFEGGSGVSSGDIGYRITAEASDVADAIYAVLNTIVPSMLQLSAMAAQMIVISLHLTLMSAVVIPCMVLVIAYLGERLKNISKKAHLSIARLSAYVNEVLPAILLVKANNAESCESSRFQKLAHADLSEHLRKKKMKVLIPQIVQAIYFGMLSILCFCSLAVSNGYFDGSSMVSFVTSLFLLVGPIQDVGKAYNELKQGEPAIERLFDLTRFESKVTENPDSLDLNYVKGDVKFSDVSFDYGEKISLVLDRLNLHIKAGETVAFVGPSGGGKTTIVKLLLRLYDPLSGHIFIDNHDIRSIRLKSLRRHVGLVSQDITLFSGTVAENIGYMDLVTEINMGRVKLAAEVANADEFIRMLPEGYKTNIGPRGSILSGGQKQRLAIARALYQECSILILDEATSALDSRSELLVRQAVQRLMQNHTVLVIAHRLETVLMAGRVFLLDGGKLEELNRSSLLDGYPNYRTPAGLII